jgi:hypothetical protein
VSPGGTEKGSRSSWVGDRLAFWSRSSHGKRSKLVRVQKDQTCKVGDLKLIRLFCSIYKYICALQKWGMIVCGLGPCLGYVAGLTCH